MNVSKTASKAAAKSGKSARNAAKKSGQTVSRVVTKSGSTVGRTVSEASDVPQALSKDALKVLDKGLTNALAKQRPFAKEQVARLRRLHPDSSPKAMTKRLTRIYLGTVTGTGAAAGATAVVPGISLPVSMGAGLADAAAFTEATVLYVLSLAEVHGLDPEDQERQRLLVLTVLVGDGAVGALNKAIPRTGGHWAKKIVEKVPMSAINRANKVLGPRFITKYGTKQGVLVLSKQIPLGVGLALGAGGNHLLGRACVKSANKIFGPPPSSWTDSGSRKAGVMINRSAVEEAATVDMDPPS